MKLYQTFVVSELFTNKQRLNDWSVKSWVCVSLYRVLGLCRVCDPSLESCACHCRACGLLLSDAALRLLCSGVHCLVVIRILESRAVTGARHS